MKSSVDSSDEALATPLLLANNGDTCDEGPSLSRVLVSLPESETPAPTTGTEENITVVAIDVIRSDCSDDETPNTIEEGEVAATHGVASSSSSASSSSCRKDAAFVFSGMATIVTIAFLCLTGQEVKYEVDCAVAYDGGCDDDDDSTEAGLLVFLVCMSFLLCWMVFRIWKAYYMEQDYKKALFFGIFICLTFFGFVLLGPVGAIIGMMLAAITCCIISKHWPPLLVEDVVSAN